MVTPHPRLTMLKIFYKLPDFADQFLGGYHIVILIENPSFSQTALTLLRW